MELHPRVSKNGFTYPKPETEELEYGTLYYIPTLSGHQKSREWIDTIVDHENLESGLVHLDEWRAEEHAEQIIKILASL